MERRLFEGFLNKNISSILHVTLRHCKDAFLSFFYLTFCCCCYSFFWFLVCFVDTQIRGCIHVGMLSCKVLLFCWGLIIHRDLHHTHIWCDSTMYLCFTCPWNDCSCDICSNMHAIEGTWCLCCLKYSHIVGVAEIGQSIL